MLHGEQQEYLLVKIVFSTMITLFMMATYTEFRYSKGWAWLSFGVYMAYVFSTSWFLVESLHWITFVRISVLFIFIPAMALFYFLSADSIGKVIFQCVTQVNLFIILSFTATFINRAMGGNANMELCLYIFLFGISSVLQFLFIRKSYREFAADEEFDWRLSATIPLSFFILLWFAILYDSSGIKNLKSTLLIYSIVGSMAVAHSVYFISAIKKRRQIANRMEDYVMIAQLGAQNQYYDMLLEKRRQLYRMRKQIAGASEMLWQGNVRQAADVLMDIAEAGSLENVRVYCQNPRINHVIAYYAARFIEHNIRFTCDMHLEDDRRLPEAEIYLILNHGLENALEASVKLPMDQRFIKLQSRIVQGQFLIRLQNHFEGELHITGNTPRTKKVMPGHGYGLSSMQAAAKRANGEMIIRTEGNHFILEVRVKATPVEE